MKTVMISKEFGYKISVKEFEKIKKIEELDYNCCRLYRQIKFIND